METGIYNMPDDEYFAADGLSNTYLWSLINKTPAHAQISIAPTPAMDFGRAVHLAVLQPEEATKQIIQGPKDRKGNKWKDAIEAAESAGGILLTEKDYSTAMMMRDRVWQDSTFAAILSGAEAKYEHAAFWEYHGQKCKGKVDCAQPGVIIDLKTSIDASPRSFALSAAKYGYHQQAASYRYGWSTASGASIDTFLFLVIEKSPPHAPAIYELDAPSMAEGWASWDAAVHLHTQCVAADHFPAYPAEKVLLSLPQYAFAHTNPHHIGI
jgi:hypothetical protein